LKKLLFLAMLILLLAMSSGCNINITITPDEPNPDPLYGKYTFEIPIYVSSLSSVSGVYISGNLKDMECNISKEKFEIYYKDTLDHRFLIQNPKYKKEIIDVEKEKDFDYAVNNVVSISAYKDKTQYIIYDKHDNRIPFRIYKLDNEIWLVSYSNTYVGNNHSVPLIFSIYKLRLSTH